MSEVVGEWYHLTGEDVDFIDIAAGFLDEQNPPAVM